MMRNRHGVQIWCRPPTRPPGLTDAEAIKDPAKWFQKKLVTCAMCMACKGQEPEKPSEKGFNIHQIKDPIKDRIPRGWGVEEGQPQPKAPKIHDDGSIVYEKTNWEPPPVPPGYKRKSDDLTSPDAWVLVRTEPLCEHCKLVQLHRESCDCVRVIPTCTYRGKAQNIQLDQCDACPNRK
jgi:hypothetical protein